MANVWRQAPSGRIDVQDLRKKGSLATLFFEGLMATITYTFVRRCDGGAHTVFDISINGQAAERVVYDNDELGAPLSAMPQENRTLLQMGILRIHMAGKTRAQIQAELANPVTVTI